MEKENKYFFSLSLSRINFMVARSINPGQIILYLVKLSDEVIGRLILAESHYPPKKESVPVCQVGRKEGERKCPERNDENERNLRWATQRRNYAIFYIHFLKIQILF